MGKKKKGDGEMPLHHTCENKSSVEIIIDLLKAYYPEAAKVKNLYSLASCGLISIPEEIGRLTNLTDLNLASNRFTSIPESIFLLSNLTKLSLASCGLTSISEEIAKLINLRDLNLDSYYTRLFMQYHVSDIS